MRSMRTSAQVCTSMRAPQQNVVLIRFAFDGGNAGGIAFAL
jgi:hypothetical protein